MADQLIIRPKSQGLTRSGLPVPALIAAQGDQAAMRFVQFFTAEIRNTNTRRAYVRAADRFCRWCETKKFTLTMIHPVMVSAYIEERCRQASAPTVKQELAAIRMLFDYLVLGHIVQNNPAAPVRGPKHVVKKGKTPVLTAEQTRELLDSIPGETIAGLRDRALIATMVFSFARVGAVIGMNVEDYYQNGKRSWLKLHEKGSKHHEVPVHHKAEEYLDAYVRAAGIAKDTKGPLFRTLDRKRQLTRTRMDSNDALRLVKRYSARLGFPPKVCNHTFRATGITTYLRNGGTLEKAAQIAAHESTRTTQLYNRVNDQISLDEIERVAI